MTDEVEITEQVSLEIERVAIQKARIRAKAAMWSLDVAAFLFAILALLITLLFMRIGTEILAPLAVFGLATGWLMGRRGERQLYQSFHNEELFKLTRELLEEKVKRANEQLQELYEHEKALRQELESEINKRAEYTRAIVHELKTPITPVLASSQLLLEEIKNEPLLSLVKNINHGASNLDKRIDELFDLARGEVGMLQLNPRRIDPTQLLQEIVNEVRPVASGNEQSLSLESPSSLPVILADDNRLRQVVLNLINNALKFTPSGGKITLSAKVDSDNLIIEVQDTGHGISRKEQEQLFDPYQQLDHGRFRHSGIGLGLALSKELVELHGGQIWVKSQKDKGSTFGFSVPLRTTNQKE